MSKPKVIVLTESPDCHSRTRDAVEHIIEPLEEHLSVRRLSVLPSDPRNGKSATKTELKEARTVLDVCLKAKYVLLVGNTPLQLVTGSAGISRNRGRPIRRGKTIFLPVNTPGIIKYDPKQEALLENDLNLFLSIVEYGGIPEEKRLSKRTILTTEDFHHFLTDLHGAVTYDVETTGLNPFEDGAAILKMGFGTRNNQWILTPEDWDEDDWVHMMVDLDERMKDCLVICHNGKFDMLWSWVHLGKRWEIDFDTMLAHYLLDENSRHGLKYLAQVFCGAPDWEVDLDTKQGRGSSDKLDTYLAHDVYYTRELWRVFSKMLDKDPDVKRVFKHIMMPVANLFVEIEYDGVFINIDQFGEAETALREEYDAAIDELKRWEPQDMKDARGRPMAFNWGSTKQLGELLYDRLGLPVIERTAAGGRSCSESVLKRLDHPCIAALLRFRKARQQLSFFIEGWKPLLHEREDGYYLHPSFKLHGTVTGRLSCENPNLQQVPRDPRIRTLISAPEGWSLIERDLSQIELRVAAELAQEPAMIHAFTHGIDLHWLTAIREIERGGGLKQLVTETAHTYKGQRLNYSQSIKALLEMGPDEAARINSEWKELRKKAKAVNFGYLYGMWWRKFKDYARDSYGVLISDEEAEASRQFFFETYYALEQWHDRQKRFAARHGYAPSLSGRKRRLPEAKQAGNTPEKKAAQRQAINSPVQSFANEINLMAALQLRKEFGRDIVRICGTVHDAVLFRVKDEYVPQVYRRMGEIMKWPELMDTFGIEMSVPIESDGSIGPWGAGVSLEEWQCSKSVNRKSRRTAGASRRTTTSMSRSSGAKGSRARSRSAR